MQSTSDMIDVCPLAELGAGETRLVEVEGRKIGVFHCADGELVAIEDRCSHDDGPLCEGDFDAEDGYAVCPRHGAHIDIRSGRPLTLPAVLPVEIFPARVDDGWVKVDLNPG